MRNKSNRREFVSTTLAASALSMGVFTETLHGAVEPVADTTAGKVRGVFKDNVYGFRGIPYGSASRFAQPGKAKAWTGVKDCIELGPRAPQPMPGIEPPEVIATDRMEKQGEDCQVLNVWTQGLNTGRRPVMVWLHGGGFAAGSAGFAIYDGANMARTHDVVLVGVNHRLNAFGYIYLAELGGAKYAHSSNAGHMDIVAALEWVRDNIGRFGGDPGNVTIFGQSGGGAKVSTLLAMPAAKGLFHRAIVQSGAALRATTKEAATKTAAAFMASIGYKSNQVDELQRLPMDKLIAATRGPFNFGPVLDGATLPSHPFDPTAPEVSANVPLMIGSTETEMTFFANTPLFPYAITDMDDAGLKTNLQKFLRADAADTAKVIEVYKKVHKNVSNIDLFLKATADIGVRSTVLTEADRKVAQGKAPTYVYYFNWRAPVRNGQMKAYHTLEIPFHFANVDMAQTMTGTGKDRYPLQDAMSGAWAAFARSGNPNHKGLPNWPAYNASTRPTMIFDNQNRLSNDPNKEERQVIASVKRAPGGPFFREGTQKKEKNMKLWKLAIPMMAAVPMFAQSAAQLEANKKVVMRFFNDNIFANTEKIDEVIHPDYIQHNPVFQRFNETNGTSGRDGLKKFLASRVPPAGGQKKAPPATPPAPPTRLITAEGDLVTVVSSRNAMDKDGKPYTSWWFDTWRVKDGKLYEHWDAATLPMQ